MCEPDQSEMEIAQATSDSSQERLLKQAPLTGNGTGSSSRFHMNKDASAGEATPVDKTLVGELQTTSAAAKNEEVVVEHLPAVQSSDTDVDTDGQYTDEINKIDLSGLTEKQQIQAREMLLGVKEAFAINDEIGRANDLEMEIKTSDDVPVQKAYNSIPRPLINEVKHHIEDMINRQWITKSRSAWSSPVVIVRKKGGDIRLCCDFRKLNQKTVPDKHPLPRVQSTLDSLAGSSWFSVLDQSRAYYQGFVSPEDRHKTAFVTPWGLFQWTRIPFGLMNAPANFQRFMEEVVSDFRDEFAIPYLDDIIVYSDSWQDHLGHLRRVLQKIKQKGLKLKASKCYLFQKEVKFLGRVVTKNGYRMDDGNIEAVRALKNFVPKTVSDVRVLLGMLGYHRRHIQDFSTIAKPITNLLLGPKGDERGKSKREVLWTKECQIAAEKLIGFITEAPVLAYPDFDKEFILHTDASQKGLGAILLQKHGDQMKVVGYGSRTLNQAEANYHPTKLEFLALKWAVSEHFQDYLGYANHFTIYTDNNPLVYLMEADKLGAFGERWVSRLSEFNFTIRYRPGIVNKDADCLSRIPLDITKYLHLCTEEVKPDAFQAVMAGVKIRQQCDETWRIKVNSTVTKDGTEALDVSSIVTNVEKLKIEQKADPSIAYVIGKVMNDNSNTHVDGAEDLSEETRLLLRQRKKLVIDKNGILRRKSGTTMQTVLPKSMRKLVYKHLHIDMGHLGSERVLEMARKRVYWPKMEENIHTFIHKKCACLLEKKPHQQLKAPLQSIYTDTPMELVTIDFLKLEKGSGGHEYVLLIVDHFTRYAQGYPCRNKSAVTAARKLYDDFILRFGFPNRILSDQGGEFENRLLTKLNELGGVTKSRTTPYHPQCNGMVERMNETLISMLQTLPRSQKTNWPNAVNKMCHAYNSTKHSVTGYSPYFLLFGREPILPIDLLLGIDEDAPIAQKSYQQFAARWKSQMEEAYRIAREKTKQRRKEDRERWSRKQMLDDLQPGCRVLVRNYKEKGGPGKLRSFWEEDVYVIVRVHTDLKVVYDVRKEGGKKNKIRVVHRNMILPVDDDFMKESFDAEVKPEIKRAKKSHKETTKRDEETSLADDPDSDEEIDGIWYPNEAPILPTTTRMPTASVTDHQDRDDESVLEDRTTVLLDDDEEVHSVESESDVETGRRTSEVLLQEGDDIALGDGTTVLVEDDDDDCESDVDTRQQSPETSLPDSCELDRPPRGQRELDDFNTQGLAEAPQQPDRRRQRRRSFIQEDRRIKAATQRSTPRTKEFQQKVNASKDRQREISERQSGNKQKITTLLNDPKIFQANRGRAENELATTNTTEDETAQLSNTHLEDSNDSHLLLTPPVQTRHSRRTRAPPKKLTYDEDGAQTVYEVNPMAEVRKDEVNTVTVGNINQPVDYTRQAFHSGPAESDSCSTRAQPGPNRQQNAYPSNLAQSMFVSAEQSSGEWWVEDQYWRAWNTTLQNLLIQNENMQQQIENVQQQIRYLCTFSK